MLCSLIVLADESQRIKYPMLIAVIVRSTVNFQLAADDFNDRAQGHWSGRLRFGLGNVFVGIVISFLVLAGRQTCGTKMNWNNTQFDGSTPVTLRASRECSSVLRYCSEARSIEPRYSFYM
jgi:hypothetical protein